jgi:hypothetical protein
LSAIAPSIRIVTVTYRIASVFPRNAASNAVSDITPAANDITMIIARPA